MVGIVARWLYVDLQDVHYWLQLPQATNAIVGTPMFAAVSVLEGGPHTESSMYESLFYSILSICRGGRMPDAWAFKFNGPTDAAKARRGVMMNQPPINMWGVPENIAALLRALHALIWTRPYPGAFMYRTDVTVEEVKNVCENFIAETSA